VISTPPIAQLERDYANFCPRTNRREAIRNRAAGAATLAAYSGERIYVVQEGDTLTSIARNELGKVSRWAEICQLNREALGKDYDYLTPGMKLAMPPRADGEGFEPPVDFRPLRFSRPPH
jgi:nucleoid-associated protein YgaU